MTFTGFIVQSGVATKPEGLKNSNCHFQLVFRITFSPYLFSEVVQAKIIHNTVGENYFQREAFLD